MRAALLLELRPKLVIALMPAWPIRGLSIDDRAYRPVGPEWSGFYDWLRAGSGRIIGVRYHTTENGRAILEGAKLLDYAAVGEYGDVSIFFGTDRNFDRAQSEDQDFEYDQVFVGGEGEYAICFSTGNLTEEQTAELHLNQSAPPRVEAVYC